MPTVFVYVLFFVSGAAGLVYELVWVRELIFVFGGTTYAITTVLVAFMAGLGLGSYVGGRAARRIARPGRAYGVLEIGIGTYALLVPLLLRIAEPSYRALYPHLENAPWLLSLARFGLSAVVLLVPTTLMGATLPVLVRYVTVRGGALGRSIAHLYGLNTGGAVCGVLAAGFWLLPVFGLSNTTRLAALANGLIGLTALLLLRGAPIQPSTRSPAARAKPAASHNPGRGPTRGRPGLGPARGSSTAVVAKMRPAVSGAQMPLTPGIRGALMAGFGVSGFAAMVYQLTWTRALVMSVGSSTYAFTCILAAFILGLALGSLAVARWVDRWTRPVRVFAVLELAIGLIAVLIVPIHGRIPLVVRGLVTQHHADYATLLAWEFLLIIAVTFLPTFLMGAIFPVVTRALARSADDAAAVTGRAYAVNTVGTVLGSFLAGFVLIRSDVLGVQNSIILASALNGLVGAALLAIQPRDAVVPSVASESSRTTRGPLRRFALPVAGLLAIAASATLAGRWDPRLLTTAPYLNRGIGVDRQMLYYAEGVDMTVAVDAPPGRPDTLTLTVNGKPDATTAPVDLVTQLLLGHVPALLHPAPRAGCVIGLGSGMTLSALARHAEFERLDCVEISAE
ncbi:MAG: fused MFS/spermidine synthase, partial [Planctomycetota bacterium]